uniref:ATP-dependent RNA helicase DHX35 n=1 Tax=Rhabditophanes sp. KR3021 TaxID=114890 RepID=A0AC35TTN7_9BILA
MNYIAEASSIDRNYGEVDSNSVIISAPTGSSYLPVNKQRLKLPIYNYRLKILYSLEKYRTLVIVGETGSGKSTQLPQYLYEAGWCDDGRLIGITQPRRVAVISLANRISEEMETNVGGKVGYAIRFDNQTSEETRIKFMTDGLLLREFHSDPLLSKYSILMIDEAHERTSSTDILLGLLFKVMSIRKDLRLVISSATLDAELFKDFFEENETSDSSKDTATILSVEGRTYPVETYYSKDPVPNYVVASVKACMNIHLNYGNGDILVFLTGMDEVNEAREMLTDQAKHEGRTRDLWILGLYGGMPIKEQMLVFESSPYGKRKVVFTTNIAEASITIPGVNFVVDCGFVKTRLVTNPKSGLEQLVTLPESQASAQQRAGRSGRISLGKCFRLFTKEQFNKLPKASLPEIQRIDFAPVILILKNLGIRNIVRFKYISRPKADSVAAGLSLLHALGAIDGEGVLLNPIGYRMSELPLPPMQAKILMTSNEFECSEEIATILAMLQIEDVFYGGKDKKHKAELSKRSFSCHEGDHITLLNVYSGFMDSRQSQNYCSVNNLNYKALQKAVKIRAQLLGYMRSYQIKMVSCKGMIGETSKILRCLLSGFFSQVAFYDHSGKYVTLKENLSLDIWKGSSIMYRDKFPKWIFFGAAMGSSVRDVSEIEKEWLLEIEGDVFEEESAGLGKRQKMSVEYDKSSKANIN